MSNCFYLDRLVPKTKLSQAEMLQINRIYRIMDHREPQLARFQNPDSATTLGSEKAEPCAKPEITPRLLNLYTSAALLLLAALVFNFSYKGRAQ